MRKCPKCTSQNVITEKRLNGDSTCQCCGYKNKTQFFDMPNNIKKLSDKNENLRPYVNEANLVDDIQEVIDKYVGIISIASAVGVLEIIKRDLINRTE